jgi:AraC-like DNA-binding protein
MAREAGHVLNETDIYREWAPPSGWEEVVACCWEQRVSAARVQRVLPDGHADLIMYDTGRIEVVRLHDQVALPVLPAGTHLRGIRFRPAAVAAAFGTPASLLRNRTVPADTVLSSKMARRLIDADAIDMWIRSIKPNPRTCAAVKLLTGRSVDEVALALDISGRHLRRLVLADIGLPPKVYQQVVRLQRFVRAIDAGAQLAVAAAATGYADQPHLTRDVRRFCGIAPARLVRERRSA